jgi:hypothetical protein
MVLGTIALCKHDSEGSIPSFSTQPWPLFGGVLRLEPLASVRSVRSNQKYQTNDGKSTECSEMV